MARTLAGRVLKAGGILAGGLAGAGAATALWSRFLVDRGVPLPPAIDAPRRSVHAGASGDVSYYVDDSASGRPLILLHSLHVAASAYEMRPLFEAFRGRRPVIAPDLPGYGFSERGARPYGPETYQRAIEALLARHVVPGGADIVALSLSCEHAALASVELPELVRSLVMISPTGFASPSATPLTERRAREGTHDTSLLARSPLLAQTTFDLLTTRASLRFQLSRMLSREPVEDVVDYAWATSHQTDAWRAPIAFLRGEPFVTDLDQAYGVVPHPTFVLFDRDLYSDYARVPDWVLHHPNWAAQRIPGTCGLPQFDAPDVTARAISHWFSAMENVHTIGKIIHG